MCQWKGGNPSILLLEGAAKTLTFQEDGVKFFPQICSVDLVIGKWPPFTKRKTFSTSRHAFQTGLPMRNLFSVDLKLVRLRTRQAKRKID